MADVLLREQTPEDEAALAGLAARTPDGGLIAFSSRLHVPEDEAVAGQHERTLGVVAQLRGSADVVGQARVSMGRCRIGAEVLPYALLGSLSVDPGHRRQGIGKALARWRIDRATALCGPQVVVVAEIQTGNAASLANARTWADQLIGRLLVAPMPMRTRPPRGRPDLLVRPAHGRELPDIADRLEAFRDGVDFARPHTAASLTAWLGSSPLPDSVNHYLVATDRSGRLLAGMGLREEGRLRSLRVHRMPRAVRAANLALAVVPPDGEMRNLSVDKVWFAPGHAEAARRLWQAARWRMRGHSTSVVATYDPRGPVRHAVRTPPWMPTTSVTLAVRAPVQIDPGRLLEPLG